MTALEICARLGAEPMTQAEASRQAVEYALGLGLETVYKEALEAEHLLATERENHSSLLDIKRNTTEIILDREQEVIALEMQANPTMSATAFSQHVKGPLRADSRLQTMRANLLATQFKIDKAEQQIKQAQDIVRIRAARLEELGGYFHYLAAIRNSTLIPSS